MNPTGLVDPTDIVRKISHGVIMGAFVSTKVAQWWRKQTPVFSTLGARKVATLVTSVGRAANFRFSAPLT